MYFDDDANQNSFTYLFAADEQELFERTLDALRCSTCNILQRNLIDMKN